MKNRTEQEMITNLKSNIIDNPQWAENIYDEDPPDPYFEPLISLVGNSYNEKEYLSFVIEQAPIHKMNVLNSFIQAKMVQAFCIIDHLDKLEKLYTKYTLLPNYDTFLPIFYDKCIEAKSGQILDYIYDIIDPEFTKGRTLGDYYFNKIFDTYELYIKLNNEVPIKEKINHKIKI